MTILVCFEDTDLDASVHKTNNDYNHFETRKVQDWSTIPVSGGHKQCDKYPRSELLAWSADVKARAQSQPTKMPNKDALTLSLIAAKTPVDAGINMHERRVYQSVS